MSEGLRKRMSRKVGDENTVARYLVEKIGHTSAIAWLSLMIVLGITTTESRKSAFLLRFVIAAVVAVGYDVFGKAFWLRAAHARARRVYVSRPDNPRFLDENFKPISLRVEILDTLFDAWVGAFTVAATFFILGFQWGALAIITWAIVLAIASNNQIGRPS